MNWKVFIARRYVKGTETSKGISFQSAIGVSGVTLGVAALLIVQAVMAGFTAKLKEQMLGATAHVLVLTSPNEPLPEEEVHNVEQTIRAVPGVVGTTPFFRKEAMIAHAEGVSAVRLFGVDPQTVGAATIFPEKMKIGSFENLNPGKVLGIESERMQAKLESSQSPRIILGSDLANSLDVIPGDEIRLICPLCGIGPLGPVPTVKTCIVAGIFEVGNVEYDAQFGFILLSQAQHFFNPEGDGEKISGIQVRISDLDLADSVAADIAYRLGSLPLWVTNWKSLLGPLFDALKLEKLALFIVLLIIVLVAAFNIAGMEILFVREKTHDIAILKAMGAPSSAVTRIFLAKGAVVGFVGTLLGLLLGLGLCWLQIHFELISIDASVYQMKYLPILIQPSDVVAVLFAPTVITTLAAYFPARRAGKLIPAEALRSQ